ncbi:MAG: hypothetical protein KatS3mg043_0525 [Rhodothermaceae bacterium]|nr:MAG: hypothetical protein KatS3mg043_0525 [Rhodothermaceae bacterium]
MNTFDEFRKACPVYLCLHTRERTPASYKYFACGKGCVLGILFEDSVNVYFEWLAEDGRPVTYPPEIRYKFWPKRELARLVAEGVWETTKTPAVV